MTEPTPIGAGSRRRDVERMDDLDEPPPPDDTRDLSLPPHSIQAEEAVLGSVLKNPRAIAVVASELHAEDFYSARNRHIYGAMIKLFERQEPIDYHSVADELTRLGVYDAAGGLIYLSELNLATPSAAHVGHYGGIVRRYAFCRRAISTAQTIAEIAYRGDLSEDDLAARMTAMVLRASSRTAARKLIYADELASRYMERMSAIGDEGALGVSTGLIDLDNITLGLAPATLIFLAARPGVGKSELAGQIALDVGRGAASAGGRCHAGHGWTLHVSIEMSEEELAERGASTLSGVDKVRLLTGKWNDAEAHKINDSLNAIAGARMAFAVESNVTSTDVRSMALQLEADKGPLDLIVVDYMQLLADKTSPESNKNNDLGWAANALKGLAKDLECCVLAPCQLSRAVDLRANKRPLLADLRDSGELEQACDIMIAMYREEMYDPDTDQRGVTELINRKHRRFGALRGHTARVLYARTRYLDLEVFRA